MKIFDVCSEIESYAPLNLAEDFDNVGLIVGNSDEDVTGVILTLDVDMAVAQEAKALGANLIVSHHPLIFEPVNKINNSSPIGRLLLYLIENRIAVYSAHTNLDSAKGGLNDILAGLAGIEDCVPLTGEDKESGIGRIGKAQAGTTVEMLAERLKAVFGLPYIRFTGDGQREAERVALCTGSGGSLVGDAIRNGAQVYITGDMKYHGVRDAVDSGIDIIELGHYDSEITATRLFEKILSPVVKTYITKANTNIFNTI